MSGTTPNKRLHEDSRGHSSVPRYSHDDSGTYPNMATKLTSSATNNYHAAFDMGQDPRMPKIPRTELHDALLQMFRMPPSLNDSHSDHPINSDDRIELRDSKDNNRDLKVENRDVKAELKELYQSAKGDKDVRFSSRGDDHKETKYDRDTYPDYRSEIKIDKDVYNTEIGHPNWKEVKEHHREKKYPDTSGGNLDLWHTSRSNVHGPAETAKEGSTTEDKDYTEAHEAVGENKVDVKGEDKLKEKDRKRQDGKHREWGERDKERNDCRNNFQVGNSSNEFKDPTKKEREAEKWERERKDLVKDKDKPRDKDTKREACNGAEKDAVDVSVRALEQENLSLEQKKQKDPDSWKDVDKEPKDRRKERDIDVEGERSEKRSKPILMCFGKELDDGGVNAEGGTEREREVLNYGVQQCKRMLRPRGSPQVANREHFRSRTENNQGPTGKPDLSSVIYQVGECMEDLTILWKDYESSQPDKISESSHDGPTLEIRIAAEYVNATNRQVRGGQLWGTDIYTDDSDLVAVLMHTGYCRPTASPPPPAIQELCATVRVLRPQECYISTLRNNVRSRAWGAAIGCSYRVERCYIVKKGGGTVDLKPCLAHASTVEPTLAPVVVERTMTTRAAASNALRQQRFVREVTIQYNLCNEPWIKYSISAVADKGLKKPLFTSARLKKGEVLYLESHSCRYELCFNGEKMVKATPAFHINEVEMEKYQTHSLLCTNGERSTMDGDSVMIDVFRWSRCKRPLTQKEMLSIGIPLPLEHVEVLEENVDWEDIQWSQTGVWISGKEYPLARLHFLSLG